MRTAITVAQTHAGKWQLLGTPADNLLEQKQKFRALRAERSHAEFSLVIYQESDGHAEILRLLTPDQQKSVEAQRAQDQAEAAKFDQEQKAVKEKNPERAKAAEEFARREKEAAEEEAAFRKRAGLPPLPTGETQPELSGNEFNLETLSAQDKGELLALATSLVEAGRLAALPEKTSKTELIKAILSAPPAA